MRKIRDGLATTGAVSILFILIVLICYLCQYAI